MIANYFPSISETQNGMQLINALQELLQSEIDLTSTYETIMDLEYSDDDRNYTEALTAQRRIKALVKDLAKQMMTAIDDEN